MDKVTADCWDFVQRSEYGRVYFGGATLVMVDDDAQLFGWQTVVKASGFAEIHMKAGMLQILVELATANAEFTRGMYNALASDLLSQAAVEH